MHAYSLFVVVESHADRAIPETSANAATLDLLDRRARGRDVTTRDPDAAFRGAIDADAEQRPDRPSGNTATAAKPRPARGTAFAAGTAAAHESDKGAVAGPSARLRALPQPTAGQLTTPDGVDNHLAQLEAARQAQLDGLSAASRSVVTAAHRETVEWILKQVRTARQHLREDVYGLCARCGTLIPPDRLTAQPWVITCTACDPPDRPVLSPVRTPEG